jgi:hypothetical protein
MRSLSVIAFGLLLMSAGQLCAQMPDPFGAQPVPRGAGADPNNPFGAATDPDPFGAASDPDPFGAASAPPARTVPVPADRKPALPPQNPQAADQATLPPAAPFPSFSVAGQTSASYLRIEHALNGVATFDYLDQPLKDVLEDISYNHKIPIVMDIRAFEHRGVDTATPITSSLKGISLRSALRLVLQDLDLAYVVRDEVLLITSEESAISNPSIRFYPVADLLPPNGDGKVLVEFIRTVVAPNTWGESGGGAIFYVEHLESVVVRQTDEVFHAIDQLLAATKHQLEEKRRSKAKPSVR